MSGEMKYALIASGCIFVVSILAQRMGPRFLGWLADKSFERSNRDPWINRDYARPRISNCWNCKGNGTTGRWGWKRCPTCLGKEDHAA